MIEGVQGVIDETDRKPVWGKLKADNNWNTDSFEQWVAVIDAKMK